MKAFEVNFDGLVGPTHNYSGLSQGNLASTDNKNQLSNPLEAVLQGIEKMKVLTEAGFIQGVLPPQERPHLGTLRKLGFTGTDKQVLATVSREATLLLSAVSNSSNMWVANAATVSPSSDCKDKKVHFTPANLSSKFHRSIETEKTGAALRKIFKNPKYFVHHEPLFPSSALSDEGAANHTRLCSTYSGRGVEFFVFGKSALQGGIPEPKKFPARQTLEASQTIARTHGLMSDAVVYGQQNPVAIDAGVFHNDVAGVGNRNVYFCHADAYVNQHETLELLRNSFKKTCGEDLIVIEVNNSEVSLENSVKSYLFNSQLLSKPNGEMILVAPIECRENSSVASYIAKLMDRTDHPIREVRFFNLRQSMRNGGGPACLRLRVVLNEKELKAINQKVLMTDRLYDRLNSWARKYYRESLAIDDLADPLLLKESRSALDALTDILGLGSFYDFQK